MYTPERMIRAKLSGVNDSSITILETFSGPFTTLKYTEIDWIFLQGYDNDAMGSFGGATAGGASLGCGIALLH